MTRWISLAAFLLLVMGGGALIGSLTPPGAWYAGLAKPPYNPPSWVFGPVWTALYALIAVAGWRTFRRAPAGKAMAAWWTQMALNFVWSPVFFLAHLPGLALAVILAMLAAILAFIALAWPRDRLSALLFLPYAAWVAFAAAVNAGVWWLN
ncbi:tryptophan-rich sensory protein [Aquibium sp. A9E412]|uniref:TspO/MBR family protein n=1 Tax=Aquibium sp. A9E412 TaxID=2976767 RepID=UPI0025AF8928|nr:TspO/MBR family protein [Aquibium sp. A9E412]MDN2567320.1 tryptophan-rich sensory protein [Aquibium sp. A9E412]